MTPHPLANSRDFSQLQFVLLQNGGQNVLVGFLRPFIWTRNGEIDQKNENRGVFIIIVRFAVPQMINTNILNHNEIIRNVLEFCDNFCFIVLKQNG